MGIYCLMDMVFQFFTMNKVVEIDGDDLYIITIWIYSVAVYSWMIKIINFVRYIVPQFKRLWTCQTDEEVGMKAEDKR